MKSSHNIFGLIIPVLAILVLLIAEGCASIGNPSGGPRDERPPRFVSANPTPGSVDIPLNKERFTLTFDELIEVKDPTSKVIISPPSKNIPRVAAQGRRVNVTFQDSLLPNTTYTIDFADAIQDLNEGNQLKNFSYTFSTGPTVDSLRIAGRVLSALGMEPMQLKLVGLHKLDDEEAADISSGDTTPSNYLESFHKKLFTQPFDHVGRTDDRGRFSIEGLTPGRYRVYALDDVNSDYIFSNSDEEVAFLDIDVSPSSSQSSTTDTIYNLKTGTIDTIIERRRTVFLPNDIILRSAKSQRAQQYIEKYERADSTRINLIFHAPSPSIPQVSIVGMPEGSDPFLIERSANSDTLALWLKSPALVSTDTLRFAVSYLRLDSVQNYQVKNDTLRLVTDRTALRRAQDQARRLLEKQQKQIFKEAKKKKESQDKGYESSDKPAKSDSIIPERPMMRVELKGGSTQVLNRPVLFETSVPPIKIDTAGIRLEEKIDTVWRSIPYSSLKRDTLNPRLFQLYPTGREWNKATEYRVIIDSLAIAGMYDLNSKRTELSFRTGEEKSFCSLTLRLTDWPSGRPAYVELLNQSDNHVDMARLESNVARFPYLTPGKYYVRVIDDRNDNGRWDSGDPLINLQPEEAYYYPKAINIKQNWNKDEQWAVFSTAVDKMKPEVLLKNKPTQPKNQPRTQQTQTSDEEEE